eukprot:scaffold13933_cov219-Amphora_coffeaeformis.AAC.1
MMFSTLLKCHRASAYHVTPWRRSSFLRRRAMSAAAAATSATTISRFPSSSETNAAAYVGLSPNTNQQYRCLSTTSLAATSVVIEDEEAIPRNYTTTLNGNTEQWMQNVSDKDTIEPSTTATLLDPEKDFQMTYPKALSPSAINEFLQCPQSFLFQYIYGLRQPTTTALAKGSICHEALEKVFDLDSEDRTLEHLQNLFRKAWSQKRRGKEYGQLFQHDSEWDLEAETAWGREALQLLENYVHYEDPRQVVRPNPLKREVWVRANLPLDPRRGSTGYVVPSPPQEEGDDEPSGNDETFLVRGIVDRLDMVRDKTDSSIVLRLTDYKTGKAPDLKYSQAMNDKIVAQNFFQLQIYALLMREEHDDKTNSLDLRYLRLLYLTSQKGHAVAWDYDLGATQVERDAVLQGVHAKLSEVWMDIVQLVSQQDPHLWHGCDRSFCYCHKCRPKFLPGTLWEPPLSE